MIFKKYVTQSEIRSERSKFEAWAISRGIEVGRNEGGYYDDSEHGKSAWGAWFARAFEGRTFRTEDR